MMDIDKIKQKILDLAIRGKLVPQDPNDEPASVLVEKIKAEKEKMVKEGKIKPSKDDSYIYKDSDNCYYENFGGKWAYVPLEALATIIMGQSPNGSDISTENGKGALEFHQGKISFTDWQIDKSGKFAINFNKVAPENSLLVCVRAPVGEVNFTNRKIAIGRGLCAIKPNTSLLDTKYLYYVLLDLKKYFLKKGKGSTFDAITVDVLKHCIIPLPSINYQRRIASVLDEGFSLLNYINRSQEEISNLAMIIKTKILDHFFGENSSYKSYYGKKKIKEIIKPQSIGNLEIKIKNIQSLGTIPVVSQSAALIDGFVNECVKPLSEVPYIVFGDHTKNVKYIDFPFIPGADGTKVFKPMDGIEPKLLYYYSLYASNNIESCGYARHFSKFKNVTVPIFDVNTQKNIICKLDKAFALIDDYIR